MVVIIVFLLIVWNVGVDEWIFSMISRMFMVRIWSSWLVVVGFFIGGFFMMLVFRIVVFRCLKCSSVVVTMVSLVVAVFMLLVKVWMLVMFVVYLSALAC